MRHAPAHDAPVARNTLASRNSPGSSPAGNGPHAADDVGGETEREVGPEDFPDDLDWDTELNVDFQALFRLARIRPLDGGRAAPSPATPPSVTPAGLGPLLAPNELTRLHELRLSPVADGRRIGTERNPAEAGGSTRRGSYQKGSARAREHEPSLSLLSEHHPRRPVSAFRSRARSSLRIVGAPGDELGRAKPDEDFLATPDRNYDCPHYDTCLGLAAAFDWSSFTCHGCSGMVNEQLIWRAHQRLKGDRTLAALCSLPELHVKPDAPE